MRYEVNLTFKNSPMYSEEIIAASKTEAISKVTASAKAFGWTTPKKVLVFELKEN